jgi:zinc transport system substrate-binding protein
MRLRALALLALLALLAGCAAPAATTAGPGVVPSFYPVFYFAQRIAGAQVAEPLIPADAEPHDYDLKPSDLARIETAKLVVYHGAGLEVFQDKLIATASAHGVPVVAASDGLQTRPSSDPDETGADPHLWLDPVAAQREASNIAAALERADPANAAAYQANLTSLTGDLQALDQAYAQGLAHCAKPRIITTHAAFGYQAARYNFTMHAISGFDPEAEPSAQKVQETADLAKRENITVIFFETLVSPRVAQVIASEIPNGTTAVLDPIEGITPEGKAAGKDYLAVMRDNLAQLKRAMECS